MHSDGLTANWQVERYPGLMQHHPALIAGVLYRDCRRGRDDSPGCCHSTHPRRNRSLLRLELAQDRDIVAARQARARQVSALLGFDSQDQVRIATAVSELARNAIRHAGGGSIEFTSDASAGRMASSPPNPLLQIIISDNGPGIANLDDAHHRIRAPAS